MKPKGIEWRYVTPYPLAMSTRYKAIHIPQGFLFDGDTGVIDLCPHCACLHDWLYATGEFTRLQADNAYADCLRVHRYLFRSLIRWVGLRLFGGRAWAGYRADAEPLKGRLLANPEQWQYDTCTWLYANITRLPSEK